MSAIRQTRDGECHDEDFASLALRPPIQVDPSRASEPHGTAARRAWYQAAGDSAPRPRGGKGLL